MWRSNLRTFIASFFLTAALSAPAWGANSAQPGTLNYVEGKASIGRQALDSRTVGSVELQAGQSLTTQTGKAEVLLTPGVFLRVGDNSTVTMISPSLSNTEVRLEKGRATVEVADIHKENNLRVAEDDADAQLLKKGLYDFDADRNLVRVFDGKAVVRVGDRQVEVKGGRELNLNDPGRAYKFDKKAYQQGDLYRWSSLRSAYLAEANVDAARIYVSNGWYGPGWYWDPWFSAYTFIPGDGVFYSPFGWGFYSPLWVYRAPLFYGGHYYRHFDRDGDYWALRPRGGHTFVHTGPRAWAEFRGGFHGSGWRAGGWHR